ncbi:hypothetical protein D3C75_1033640 [compost metagenome]
MASIKLTQTTTHIVEMKKVKIGTQSSILSWHASSLEEGNEMVIGSFWRDVDLKARDYYHMTDERSKKHFIVSFPKGAIKGPAHAVTKYLLGEFVQWGELVFDEWVNKFKGQVDNVTKGGLVWHRADAPPMANVDRLYFCIYPERDKLIIRNAVVAHKKKSQPK